VMITALRSLVRFWEFKGYCRSGLSQASFQKRCGPSNRGRCRRAGHEDRIDWLSRYLGHERVSDTYWYLSGTPQLFAATAKQFKHPAHQ